MSKFGFEMYLHNKAIVWAPNLLRSRPPTTGSSNASNSRTASHQVHLQIETKLLDSLINMNPNFDRNKLLLVES